MDASEITIFGIGNLYRCDDGAGLRVLELLKTILPSEIPMYQGSGDEAVFIELWQGKKRAYVVDAVSSGAKPGNIFKLSVHDLVELDTAALSFRCSTHSFDLRKCIDLARIFDSLPEELVIFGIEAQNFDHGMELSKPVEEAVHKVAGEILSEITLLLRYQEESPICMRLH